MQIKIEVGRRVNYYESIEDVPPEYRDDAIIALRRYQQEETNPKQSRTYRFRGYRIHIQGQTTNKCSKC